MKRSMWSPSFLVGVLSGTIAFGWFDLGYDGETGRVQDRDGMTTFSYAACWGVIVSLSSPSKGVTIILQNSLIYIRT